MSTESHKKWQQTGKEVHKDIKTSDSKQRQLMSIMKAVAQIQYLAIRENNLHTLGLEL